MSEQKVILGQYKGLKRPVMNTEVTDEEIMGAIEHERQSAAKLADADRAAKLGDTVVIDFAGFLGEEQFEGGTAEKYALELGSGSFIPGFEEQLVGHSAGDQVDVNVTFPENYHAENLAGKPVVFKCTVHQVQEKQLPELNDDFARNYGAQNMDHLKEAARVSIASQKAKQAKEQAQTQVLEQVVAASQVTVEERAVEEQLNMMLRGFEQQLSTQGMTMEMFMQMAGTDMETMRANARPQAEDAAKANAVLSAVADEEGIEISEEELEAEVRAMAEAYEMDFEQVKAGMTDENRTSMRNAMRGARALEKILGYCED